MGVMQFSALQLSRDRLGVKMCTRGAPTALSLVCLSPMVSSTLGDKILSRRQFSYTTTTCIRDGKPEQTAINADCPHKCKQSSNVIIKTIMETASRVKRYSFDLR